MKSVLLLALSITAVASAEPTQNTTVLYNNFHRLNVALNNRTVLCSGADYSAKFLKVLIPQLSGLTLLNHRNDTAAAPCVAAGPCEIVGGPGRILNPNQPNEVITLQVTGKQQTVNDRTTNSCQVFLIEDIETTIRGVNFFHQRRLQMPFRQSDDCK